MYPFILFAFVPTSLLPTRDTERTSTLVPRSCGVNGVMGAMRMTMSSLKTNQKVVSVASILPVPGSESTTRQPIFSAAFRAFSKASGISRSIVRGLISGYARAWAAATSAPPYSAPLGELSLWGSNVTKAGGLSMSVVMSCMAGTVFALYHHMKGTKKTTRPKSTPMAGTMATLLKERRNSVRPTKDKTAETAPAKAAHLRSVKPERKPQSPRRLPGPAETSTRAERAARTTPAEETREKMRPDGHSFLRRRLKSFIVQG